MLNRLRILRSPSVRVPALTLLALAFLGLIYYFFWVRARSERYDDLAFRRVSSISDDLFSQLRLYRSVLDRSWPGISMPGNPIKRQLFAEFVATEAPELHIGAACPSALFPVSDRISNAPEETPVEAIRDTGAFPVFGKTRGCISMQTLAAGAIGRFPEDLFDEIVIVSSHGPVLYQTTRTGIRFSDLSGVYPELRDLVVRNGGSDGKNFSVSAREQSTDHEESFDHARGHSGLANASIVGTEYRIYLTPIAKSISETESLQIPGQEKGQGASGRETIPPLMIAGLVRKSRFDSDVFAPNKNIAIWVLLAVLWVLVGFWPLLRLIFTHPGERTRGRTLASIVLMNLMAGSVLGLGIAHFTDAGLDDTTDLKLRSLAERVERHLGEELSLILKTGDDYRPRMEAGFDS